MSDEKRLVTVEDLYRIISIEDPRISPDGKWAAFVRVDVDKKNNTYRRNLWLCPLDGGNAVQLTRGDKDSQPRWSPDGRHIAFVSGRGGKPQVYVIPVTAPGGEAHAVTELPNGANSPAWSPEDKQIAFLSSLNADERQQEDEPEEGKELSKPGSDEDKKRLADPRVLRQLPYRTGTSYLDDRFAQVYVVDVPAPDAPPAKARRLTNENVNHQPPQWSPDGRYLYTGRAEDPDADEPWRHSLLYRIEVESGAIKPLTDDTHASLLPLPSPDGRYVAYMRFPHDGAAWRINRLTVVPTEAGEARDLNLQADLAIAEYRWQGSDLLFSTQNRGRGELYRVPVSGGEVVPVLQDDLKVETFDVHDEGRIVYSATTWRKLQELFVYDPGKGEPRQLTQFNGPFLAEVQVQTIHPMPYASAQGQAIDGWYLLPAGYEESKSYPLVVDIHGGPHVMWGAHEAAMWHEWQFLAAQGYVVFFCNPRGSGGYGEAFQQAAVNAWGDVVLTDVMAGLEQLITKGFVDIERLGITGGSYGGYATTWIVSHSDRFKAAVTQRGVYNILSFFGTADIPTFVFDEFETTPLEDPLKLWEHSPLAHAHRITVPLLIIHSENDFRVPLSEAEQMFTYVHRNGVETELVVYPREGHELSRSGEPEHRIDRLTRITGWFDRFLKS
jgi:dipeptidyl aminopeptidase/acylaminoacyl peptidase